MPSERRPRSGKLCIPKPISDTVLNALDVFVGQATRHEEEAQARTSATEVRESSQIQGLASSSIGNLRRACFRRVSRKSSSMVGLSASLIKLVFECLQDSHRKSPVAKMSEDPNGTSAGLAALGSMAKAHASREGAGRSSHFRLSTAR